MIIWLLQLYVIARVIVIECVTSFLKFFAPIGYYPRKDIKGNTIILTGAANGIGRRLAQKLSKSKVNLILWDIDEKNLERTKNLCKNFGTEVRVMNVNVTDYSAVEAAYKKVIDEFNFIDILINNAGMCTFQRLIDIPRERIRQQIELNFVAPLFITKLAIPGMMERNVGHIVITASSRSLIGKGMISDYSAEKQGLSGFMEALEDEMLMLGKRGIKFTTVCPLLTKTNLTRPLGNTLPLLSPDTVAEYYLDAILCEKRVAVIPKRLILIYWLKMFLPSPVYQLFT